MRLRPVDEDDPFFGPEDHRLTGTPEEVEVRTKSSGKTVVELAIRENTGATIVAIRRGDELIANPDAQEILHEGDHVYLIGGEEQIRRAMRLL